MTTMSNNGQRNKCTRCKVNLTIDKFKIKRDGLPQKRCIECNIKGRDMERSNKCEHEKTPRTCKECDGGSRCIHGRMRTSCKECDGGSICTHGRIISTCRECDGVAFCSHGKRSNLCKDCGGSTICVHNRQINYCKECNGSSICTHNKIRNQCVECDPLGYIKKIVSGRVNSALDGRKTQLSVEYLGCNIEEFKEHIESQFKEGMTWDNHGKWHIDHIIPIKYNNPSIEEVYERLHYINTQPLWAAENIAKGNRYIG